MNYNNFKKVKTSNKTLSRGVKYWALLFLVLLLVLLLLLPILGCSFYYDHVIMFKINTYYHGL